MATWFGGMINLSVDVAATGSGDYRIEGSFPS
jgi:hypothetical protein